ncbi:hypothetical protein FRC01_010548 [Tulasnella sp. 417]|nr:hypothetical protein FRC01_010548 [Tulasnella sp. 417]
MSSSLPMALRMTDPSPFNDTPSAPSQAAQHLHQQQHGTHQRRQQLQINTQDIQPNPAFAPHPNLELQHHGESQAHDDSAPSPVTSVSATSPIMVQRPPSAPATRTRSATTASSQPKREQSPQSAHPEGSSPMTSPPKLSAQLSASTAHNSPGATTSTTGGGGGSKRKRSRVTPEQLAYLERVFAMDRSPGAAKRKEISELLGMQERQTQPTNPIGISLDRFGKKYLDFENLEDDVACSRNTLSRFVSPTFRFQNRRAKAKMMEARKQSGGARAGSIGSPLSPPELGMASDADLQAMIHAGEPITIIQCTDLTIGTWHRIAARTGTHDLVAYTAEGSEVLTWYIYSEGYGFRMDLPFRTIERVDLSTTGYPPGTALATITLTQAPNFFMESNVEQGRMWKKCTDWTEGQQASTMLRHEVIGSAAQLYQALSRFPGNRSPAPSPPPGAVVLRAPHSFPVVPTYSGVSATYSDPPSTGSHHSPLHSPSLEFVGSPVAMPAAAPQFPFQSTPPLSVPQHVLPGGRHRSHSGPAAFNQDLEPVLESPVDYPGSPFSPYPPAEDPTLAYPIPQPTVGDPSAQYGNTSYSYAMQPMGSVPVVGPRSHHQPTSSLSDFAAVPISHTTRPFSSHGVPQSELTGSPSHVPLYMPQQPMGDMMPLAGSPVPLTTSSLDASGLGGGYASFGEGGEALLHQVSGHHTPPHIPLHRTSSTEPTSSLSGALGDYPSTRSPHPGGSPYHPSS